MTTAFEPFDPEVRSPRLDPRRVTIRAATVADIPRLAAMAVAERGRSPSEGSSSASVETWSELFGDNLGRDDRWVVVAEAADRLVGYGRTGWFEPAPDAPEDSAPAGWYLMGLVVDPAWRRRGVARALTIARLEWLRARTSEAWYFANSRNRVSLALHGSLGFEEVTREFSFPGTSFGHGTGVLGRVRWDGH